MRGRIRLDLLLLLMLAGLTCRAAETSRRTPPAEEAIAPFPAVTRYAAEHHIPLTGFEAEANTAEIERYAVALVTLLDGRERQQWLVRLELAPLTTQPKSDLVYTIYTNAGSKFTFGQTHLVRVKTTTWGPFRSDGDSRSVKATADTGTVDLELLALGLYRCGNVVGRIIALFETMARQHIAHPPGALEAGTSPYPEEKIKDGKRFADRFAITAEDERAFSGAFPALISFFSLANSLRGLDAIVGEMVSKAAIGWSVLRHGGLTVGAGIDFSEMKTVTPPAGLGTNPAYQFKFTISGNGNPLLYCHACAVAPRPYLLGTAGIYTLTAQSAAYPTKRVTVEVLAAGRNAATKL